MNHLTRRLLPWAVATALATCVAGPAGAAADVTSPPPRSTALTFSLTTPLADVVELAWEQSWGYGFSTVVMGGVGIVPLDDIDQHDEFNLIEAGLQARYTFVGDFDEGMGIAIVGRYLWADPLLNGSRPHGYAVGPHLFYRVSNDFGLTLDFYLGGSIQEAFLVSPNGEERQRRSDPIPTSGLSLGWSFGQ